MNNQTKKLINIIKHTSWTECWNKACAQSSTFLWSGQQPIQLAVEHIRNLWLAPKTNIIWTSKMWANSIWPFFSKKIPDSFYFSILFFFSFSQAYMIYIIYGYQYWTHNISTQSTSIHDKTFWPKINLNEAKYFIFYFFEKFVVHEILIFSPREHFSHSGTIYFALNSFQYSTLYKK